MKKSILLITFYFSTLLLAEESICKSTAGQMLAFTVSNTVFVGEESRPYFEIKKALNDEFNTLCKSDKSSSDIISEMYNRCFKLTQEFLKNKESKAHFEKACDIAFTAGTYYTEGNEKGKIEGSDNNCENKNSSFGRSAKLIENQIPSDIPESAKVKMK